MIGPSARHGAGYYGSLVDGFDDVAIGEAAAGGIHVLKPELASGRIRLKDSNVLKRAFPDLLLLSGFADTKRQR